MSKLTPVQIATAKSLLRDLNKSNPNEKEIFIVEESKHHYSKLENAIAQAAGKGDVYRLTLDNSEPELVTLETSKDEKKNTFTKSLTPDATWKFEELKSYAPEKGIVLETTDRSKESVIAKIAAASEPAK